MLTIYLKQYNKIIRNAEPELLDNLGFDDILWIDLLSPSIKEQKAVENFIEESLQTRQQVEEIESTSKYSETENSIISNTNFFIPTGDSFDVEPVSFIISNEGVLVSMRSAESRTFREAEKRLQMNYRSFSTGYHIFISLLEVRIDFDADLVEFVAKQVAALSKDINTEDTIDKEVIHRINALQENTIVSNSNFFVPTGDSFTVEPVSFTISNEGVLVSVRQAEFRTFREAEKRLQMNYRSYSTGYHIFISLLEVRIDYDADLVEMVAKQVGALSKEISTEDSIDKEIILRINSLQESTMLLRENIFDRQRVLSGVLRSERFPNDIYPRLQLMIKDVNSLINHADFSFQRLDYIQDSALGLINIEQNEIVKIFSVASVIFMPATLIASMYGMNFKLMPELDWVYTFSNGFTLPLGYLFAIGLMVLCSGVTIWFFRFKKWL